MDERQQQRRLPRRRRSPPASSPERDDAPGPHPQPLPAKAGVYERSQQPPVTQCAAAPESRRTAGSGVDDSRSAQARSADGHAAAATTPLVDRFAGDVPEWVNTPAGPSPEGLPTEDAEPHRAVSPVAALMETAVVDSSSADNAEPEKCWICFDDESDSVGLRWVKPCRCSLVGHEQCLLNWISEKQREQDLGPVQVNCPQCNEPFHVVEKHPLLLRLFDLGEAIVRWAMPVITGTGLAVIGLLTSTTYGAHAVLAMCGAEDGERLLGVYHPWTWKVWLGLPIIPLGLIVSRTRLFDPILPLIPFAVLGNDAARLSGWPPSMSVTMAMLPWVRLVYGSVLDGITATLTAHWTRRAPSRPSSSSGLSPASQSGSANNEEPAVDEGGLRELELLDRPQPARLVAGALLFPTISSVCGRMLAARLSPCGAWLRRVFPTIFLRSMAGGCAFVALKDAVNLVYKYQKVQQRRSRRVKNWFEQ